MFFLFSEVANREQASEAEDRHTGESECMTGSLSTNKLPSHLNNLAVIHPAFSHPEFLPVLESSLLTETSSIKVSHFLCKLLAVVTVTADVAL